MRRILVLSIVLLTVLGGAYWKFFRVASAGAQPQLKTAEVTRGAIATTISATARLVSNLDVDIKCKASGEVVRVQYDVSQFVKKGDLLIELDPTDEKRAVTQAAADLAASQAKLAQAKQACVVAELTLATDRKRADAALRSAKTHAEYTQSKADRLQPLFEKGFCTTDDIEAARNTAVQAQSDYEATQIRFEELKTEEANLELKRQDVLSAEAQVSRDYEALADAKQRLVDTKVYAPIDGTVSGRTVEVGQIVASPISNVGGGTALLSLSDLSRIFALASVDESDIGRVSMGQEVAITTDAFPAVQWEGRVVQIATKGVNVSNVVTFEVKIEVLGENKKLLKPEMTGNVKIILASRKDVLLVPVEALVTKGSSHEIVVVDAPGRNSTRQVEIGLNDGERAEVLSGVQLGERVVLQEDAAKAEFRKQQAAAASGPAATADVVQEIVT